MGLLMRLIKPVLALAVVYTAVASPAFAYLDGATGSMILQALIAGAATALMFGRTLLQRIKNFFRGGKAPAQDAE
jgi:hypothetical protein